MYDLDELLLYEVAPYVTDTPLEERFDRGEDLDTPASTVIALGAAAGALVGTVFGPVGASAGAALAASIAAGRTNRRASASP